MDPILKNLETLRQVYPEGMAALVAPTNYDPDMQWLFVLSDASETDYMKGFDPTCGYRFFPGGDSTKGHAFRTGQEALVFARETESFDMERFEQQINTRLVRLYMSNMNDNTLIEAVFPGQTMDEVYAEAHTDAVIRRRYAIKKLQDSGYDVAQPGPTLTAVKKDDTND